MKSILLALAAATTLVASSNAFAADDDAPKTTNALRRVLLSIDLTQAGDTIAFAKLMASMTHSRIIDKWVGSCLLNSYMDTAYVDEEAKTMSATMTLTIRQEGKADCTPERSWIEQQLNAVTSQPGVKLESTLTDEHD